MRTSPLRLAATAGLLAVAVTSCGSPESDGLRAAPPGPTSHGATLVPADARHPRVAGACAGPGEGPVGVVEVNADAPAPRCLVVRPDQRVKVHNATQASGQAGSRVTVTFGEWSPRTLRPGASVTFRDPVGQALAPGVHDLDLAVAGQRWLTEVDVQAE